MSGGPVISVLLPTLRPQLVARAVDSIRPACGDVPYEIVVVADFGPEALQCSDPTGHLGCRWIQRERRGVVDAVNVACQAARGSHWFLFNDEAVLEAGALAMLYHAAQADPGCVLTPRHVPGYTFEYFGLPFAAFPFAHRALLERLGGLLDPAFKSFYADPDLGMRAHAAGVPIRTLDAAAIHHSNGSDDVKAQNVRDYMALDQATFRARWGHLGEFHDC